MKRILLALILLVVIFLLPLDVSAEAYDEVETGNSDIYNISEDFDTDNLYDSLNDEVRDSLSAMGVDLPGADTIDNVSVKSIFSEVVRILSNQAGDVVSASVVIAGVMFLYSIINGIGSSFASSSAKEVLSVVSSLSVACILAVPLSEIIGKSGEIIRISSDFMLAYIPLMVSVLMACGKTLSGAGYYSLMIFYAELITQVSSTVIVPALNVFLGISVSASLVPEMKLKGMLNTLSKSIKWLLSFMFTIFSALLTFRTLIAASADSVSTRALRYTLSSFVPVIGAALSEAYRTVSGSFAVLRSGVGVFAIFAVFAMFLPVIIKLILWMFSVNILKNIAQIVDLSVPSELLSGVIAVLSVILAVIICVAALYIISTALIIIAGGGV